VKEKKEITAKFLVGCIFGCRIFSPDSPCEEIESDKKTHIFLQPEEDIWMLMVSCIGGHSQSVLLGLLRFLHFIHFFVHTSVRSRSMP
jgi:hypothetical protein